LTRSITSFWSSGYRGTAVATANRRGTASIESTLSPKTGPRNAECKATLCTWRFCRGGDPPGAISLQSGVHNGTRASCQANINPWRSSPAGAGLRSSRPRSRSSFFWTFDYAVRLGNMAGPIFELSLGEQGFTISRLRTSTYLLR
jgi:hypothetical protein